MHSNIWELKIKTLETAHGISETFDCNKSFTEEEMEPRFIWPVKAIYFDPSSIFGYVLTILASII